MIFINLYIIDWLTLVLFNNKAKYCFMLLKHFIMLYLQTLHKSYMNKFYICLITINLNVYIYTKRLKYITWSDEVMHSFTI